METEPDGRHRGWVFFFLLIAILAAFCSAELILSGQVATGAMGLGITVLVMTARELVKLNRMVLKVNRETMGLNKELMASWQAAEQENRQLRYFMAFDSDNPGWKGSE